jgi:putative membrane protein
MPTTEALLAYAHILAILTLATFLASEAALCRSEWLNAAVVERLARVDAIYGASAVVVLATGLARTWWGVKGTAWYWSQPLLHAKVGLFVVIGLMSIVPTVRFLRWRRQLRATGALPAESEVRSTRRIVMIEAHLVALIPLLAVFLARGIGTR